MLSTKKLFTEHLLTLVLTLSLLRIDPENYLDLQWGGRLARVGDAGGWQLELLAAGPDYSNQSYVNRKFLPPIIEDLSRFERPFIEQNHRGLQTYLLNVLDANDDGASAGTLAEERPPSPVPAVASGGGSGVGVGTVLPAAHNATMHALTNLDVDAEDIFLSADLFEETTSVLEQNMADLSEYDTILLEHPTVKFDAGAASLPDLEGTIARARTLMNEASKKFEVKREEEKQEDQATTSSSATGATPTEGSGVVRANKTRAYEDDDDDEDSEDERDSKEAVQRQINTQQKHLVCTDLDTAEVTVKTEPVETNDTTVQESSTAAAAAQDLTQEVKTVGGRMGRAEGGCLSPLAVNKRGAVIRMFGTQRKTRCATASDTSPPQRLGYREGGVRRCVYKLLHDAAYILREHTARGGRRIVLNPHPNAKEMCKKQTKIGSSPQCAE